jgi:hypothetical protein
MHDVQVNLIDAESAQALLGLGERVPARGVELRGEKNLLAGNAALAQSTPNALLVAVSLRRIDVAVPKLQCPADGVLALGTIGDLPDAEAERGDRCAIAQYPPAFVTAVCGVSRAAS